MRIRSILVPVLIVLFASALNAQIIDPINIQPAWTPYYTTMSGTSMATPHIAGVCALMYDANPNVTPDQIKAALMSTATVMPGYAAHQVGAGYVNAYAAVAAVQ